MSDELECFRKASELGCPDFEILGNAIRFDGMLLQTHRPKYNRYAAAVCAEFWAEEARIDPLPKEKAHALIMQERARAFGKKYGN